MRARAVILACVGVALLLGAVARSATGQAPSFAKPKLYAAKEEPQATAVGDLNGDGKPDLVSVGGNRDSGVASVFFNDGKGRLASRRDYDTAFQPRESRSAISTATGRPTSRWPTPATRPTASQYS
jgi:hypothetical protein